LIGSRSHLVSKEPKISQSKKILKAGSNAEPAFIFGSSKN
jgi:hypothetical protein